MNTGAHVQSKALASSCGLFIMLTLTLTSVRLNHYISMSKHSLWPLCADWGSETQSRWWCETISRQQIVDWSFTVDTEFEVIHREEHRASYVKNLGLIHKTHTHKIHSHSHTHTHTHVGFPCFMGTFHRRNGFYTVQTVYSIPLHCPYP